MPKLYCDDIKQQAINLRQRGYSYKEIQKSINYPIPKNTFTGWFKQIVLSGSAQKRIVDKIRSSGAIGRSIAWRKIRDKRKQFVEKIQTSVNEEIKPIDQLTAKLCLAMLYLGEGGKTNEWIRLGNSDHKVIEIFLALLRSAFELDEAKLRGKVQCRADQNIVDLERYWSEISKIPLSRFQKTQIDKRTIGIPTRKPNYKGVFVVEYYSNALFLELKFFSDIMHKRLVKGPWYTGNTDLWHRSVRGPTPLGSTKI